MATADDDNDGDRRFVRDRHWEEENGSEGYVAPLRTHYSAAEVEDDAWMHSAGRFVLNQMLFGGAYPGDDNNLTQLRPSWFNSRLPDEPYSTGRRLFFAQFLTKKQNFAILSLLNLNIPSLTLKIR